LEPARQLNILQNSGNLSYLNSREFYEFSKFFFLFNENLDIFLSNAHYSEVISCIIPKMIDAIAKIQYDDQGKITGILDSTQKTLNFIHALNTNTPELEDWTIYFKIKFE
jgi:hypothetical protein